MAVWKSSLFYGADQPCRICTIPGFRLVVTLLPGTRQFIQSIRYMQAGKKLFIAAVGLIIICGWTARQAGGIKKAEWLIGTWENKTGKGSIYETWSKVDDNAFLGKSYAVKEMDTIVFENMRLVREQNGSFYIPVVKNQNDGLPVRFAAKTITGKQLVFENAEHDFPQVISYTKISADSLVAEISGIKNGQERRQMFPMKRVLR